MNVLVTGASGAIGTAATIRLAELGATVYAGVRSATNGFSLYPRVRPIDLDICDADSIAAARDKLVDLTGGTGLHGLVNAAGITVNGPLELVSVPALRQQLEVNVISQIAVTQAMLPLLRRTRGRVVNIGGAVGRMTLPLVGGLSASKAALDSLTTSLRMELKHQGMHVCYVEPGPIDTGFFARAAGVTPHDGNAGGSEARTIYEKAIAASTKALVDRKADPPEAVVRVIVKALTARRPAPRYVVGNETKVSLMLLPHLPQSLRDRLVMSSLGLGKRQFSPHTGS